MAFRLLLFFLSAMAALTLGIQSARASEHSLFDAPALSDAELGEARGGFALPNGVNVNIAAQLETSLNGVKILSTSFVLGGQSTSSVAPDFAQEPATLAVLPDISTETEEVASLITEVVEVATAGAEEPQSPATSVTDAAEPAEQFAVVTAPATGTTSSSTSTASEAQGGNVTYTADVPGLNVEHTIGSRIASVIANTLDNSVIDHRTTIDITLSDVRPMEMGSLPFRINNLAIDAMTMRSLTY